MNVRYLVLGLTMLSASAQQKPAPKVPPVKKVGHGPTRGPAAPRMFASANDIAGRIADADAAVEAGKDYDGTPLLLQNGYRVTMEWRNEPQDSIHAHVTDAEMFVILEGSGIMTLGGTLVSPHLSPAGLYEGPTMSSKQVKGAKEFRVTKGDMIMIPENTPHAVTGVNGGKLVLWSMILPHQANIRDNAEQTQVSQPRAPASSSPTR